MNHDDRLTPEERELAALLGKLPPHQAPPPQLDRAILDAARAAVAPAATASDSDRASSARRRLRWPNVLGIAASLVLVTGIAWQLRPLPPTIEAPAPAASPAQPLQMVSGEASPAPPAARTSQPAPVVKQLAPPKLAPVAPSKPLPAPPPPPPPLPAPAMVAEPMSQMAPAADVPAATQQANPARQADKREGLRMQSERSRAPLPAAAPAPAPALVTSPAPPAPLLDSYQRTSSANLSSPAMEQSSVEADAALSRRQWLKRIRERREHGDLDGARASLALFQAHYPSARVPRDLRELLPP